ncbi:MAG: hypothetical protein Q9182_001903 [Xanthomendoza sp. 2 TL-2023]
MAVPEHAPQRQTDPNPNVDSSKEGHQVVEKAPSVPLRIWQKSGLNLGMLAMMFKGALAPTIALALYQSTGFADTYATLGYLVAIMSILSFVIIPRAKFVQMMLFNIIGICIGFCIALLSIYCSVQARAHTSPQPSTGPKSSSGGPSPGAAVAPYNSSASAVCAIWLFFNLYVSNTLRASRPQLQFPVIMYSIFTNVASTYAPQFATMTQGIAFARRLIEAFLTGFAIAIGVSFLVFPLTSRTVVFKTMTAYIGALRGALKAQSSYLESLEDASAFGITPQRDEEIQDTNKKPRKPHKQKKSPLQLSPEAQTLKAAVANLGELHGKVTTDMPFAKREVAFGNLDASEISELVKLLRQVMLPIIGMTSVADIFDRVAGRRGWRTHGDNDPDHPERSDIVKDKEKEQWSEIMRTLHQPFEVLTEVMDQGLHHALLTLELEKRRARQQKTSSDTNGSSADLEANGEAVKPGDEGFADFLCKKIDQFYEQRKATLDIWCRQNGMNMQTEKTPDLKQPQTGPDTAFTDHQTNQRRLYLILYMEFLLWSTGRAVLDLVKFADSKLEQGTLSKKRLIVPGMKRVKKWISAALDVEDSSADHAPDTNESAGMNIVIGDAYQKSKDPEHLPPTNAWQRFGNGVRTMSQILGSQQSAFGFRVACATLSIGIVAFLEDTQIFFIQQRLVWAMIMVSIGMTVTAGAGVFGFIGRIAGTGKTIQSASGNID